MVARTVWHSLAPGWVGGTRKKKESVNVRWERERERRDTLRLDMGEGNEGVYIESWRLGRHVKGVMRGKKKHGDATQMV